MTPSEPDLERVRSAFGAAGQGHVFADFDRLPEAARARLFTEARAIDLGLLARLVRELKEDRPVATLDLERIEPAPYTPARGASGRPRRDPRSRAAGEDLLRSGKVAAMVVAGGQGSRLGFAGPKGCFPFGPVTGCSLFEWHAAKVRALRARFGGALPLLVMTSAANHAETVAFFERHRWFGLPASDVIVFSQGMLPAVDLGGRLVVSAPGELFLSPDGHGGSLLALRRSGALDEITRRGVEEIFYFQVDNPLVRVCDPTFVGQHRLRGSEMSSKVVMKRDASEKVGVFARAGRKTGVVEYSDLAPELATAVDEAGRLRFRAGNIAIHALSVAFVKRITEGGLQLPYHRAVKPHASGKVVKFETFVFDALPLAKRALIVETERAEEFSPIKNATGEDSVETAGRDVRRVFESWLAAAGLSAAPGAALEFRPDFALDQDEFVRRVKREKTLSSTRLLLE